jgi:TolA-binding protein
MRRYLCTILIHVSLLLAWGSASTGETVPSPAGNRLPNVKASLDDGFYALAEQQARGVLRSGPDKQTRREATLLLAHALWGQKRYSELLDLLDDYDGEAGFVYWRARAHFELKQYEAALQDLAQAGDDMEAGPYGPSALRLRGHIEYMTGRLDDAEATFLQFSVEFADHRDRIENQFDLAEVYVDQEKIDAAISVYEVLAAEAPEHAAQRARLKLAHLLYTHEAAESTDRARSMFLELATHPDTRLAYRIDAFVDLAALEETAGDHDAATAALRKAIAISPDALHRVPVKLSLARLLLREDDTTGALKLLEECRAEVPNETLAAALQLEKANALLQAGRVEEAGEAYQVYLDVAGDAAGLARAYFGKGLALWELARYSESAAALDKAVKGLSDPGIKAEALFKSGDAYYSAGNFSDAEKRYRTFVEEFPNHADFANALYQHGLALAKTERRTEALAVFHTLEADYADSEFAEKAALRSADVMRAGERWEAALDKYAEIEQTYTNSPTAATSLHQSGLLLYRLGRSAESQETFEGVLAKYPQSEHVPEATFMRGFCLYRQGQINEAVETCQMFIDLYPDSEWIPEVVFWQAGQYYNQADYAQAEPLFMRVAMDYKDIKLAPRAFYWAGRAAAAQADYVTAIERYSTVARDYPDSDVLAQTRFAQGDALSELGEFARAILAFEEIIKNYPESHLVSTAWGRKGDCQFSLAVEDPARYAEAMNSYQAILDRPLVPSVLKLQAEYKLGRCLEKTEVYDQAFNRYMNVVYTFINENVERSPYSVMWFTRAAFGAATLKEKEKAWSDAVQIYRRVIEANVPAKEEAANRIEKIKKENWLLIEQAEEMDHVGIDG